MYKVDGPSMKGNFCSIWGLEKEMLLVLVDGPNGVKEGSNRELILIAENIDCGPWEF